MIVRISMYISNDANVDTYIHVTFFLHSFLVYI